jgi:hypothetical protein
MPQVLSLENISEPEESRGPIFLSGKLKSKEKRLAKHVAGNFESPLVSVA